MLARIVLCVLLVLLLTTPAHADRFDLPWPEDLTGDCASDAPLPRTAAASEGRVAGALRKARRSGAITAEQASAWTQVYADARRVRRSLPAARRRELRSVVDGVEDLARRGSLSASRMPIVFLQLQRNVEWWPEHGGPRTPQPPPSKRPCAGQAGLGGARVTFPGDPIVFQWYPGMGLQVQPLATFGKVNALAKDCLDDDPSDCRHERLRRGLDRIVFMASDRGGFLAWEYFFAFGGGTPPWISGLATATAMQALSRGTLVLGDPKYLHVARRARRAFERPAPTGVRVRAAHGAHYALYSFNPRLRVLNGFLQSLTGLWDYAEIADDDTARRLFREGDREARHEVPPADTGAWSRYSAGGAESDLGYHRLVRDFLQNLCDRTQAEVYCGTSARFTRYLHEFPRVRFLRSGTLMTARFWLSKVSCVTLRVRRSGRVVFRRELTLGRGARSVPWVATRQGTYTVELTAEDLMRHRTTIRHTVEVAA